MAFSNKKYATIVLISIFIFRFIDSTREFKPKACVLNDENQLFYINSRQLLNLTDFRYTLQPEYCLCDQKGRNLLGAII